MSERAARQPRAARTLHCPRCKGPTLLPFTVTAVPLHVCDRCDGHLLANETTIALAQRPGSAWIGAAAGDLIDALLWLWP